MRQYFAKTFKKVSGRGVCGFVFTISFLCVAVSHAEEPEHQKLTVALVNEISVNNDMDADLQADRRAWLASLRAKKIMDNPDYNEIVTENLDDDLNDGKGQQKFSRDILQDYVVQIGHEVHQPE